MMLDSTTRQQLVATALEARQWAYAPYSGYAVGAALLTASGKIYDGVNVENAAYPDGICAERVAVFKAISEGEREFIAIAVVSQDGGFPCGSCRQVLSEFGLNTLVIIANPQGEILQEATVSDLLPHAFGPQNLRDR
ncbi:MAG: cytidine deaminase [Thermanaerothrix sp.]|uniref:Cytidine deaminase n=1 Tax=Thermanaerothrix solaris TaxID=3058434 RepID=A0ABU3NQE1_9CHLR|nr:cytidine deaminase [Thermanaerothrix sp. 4228-RoL]MDT8899044.1 cytidine deaminase [Thermanaerothrix sp. 4228-RoL]